MARVKKNESENFILSYYQGMKDGTIVVGQWVMLLYELIIQGLQDKRWFYDHKKALKAIKYFEKHVFHVEGPLAPKVVKLELWQKALLSLIYGIVDENGKRQFREIFLLIARKNGKSIIASGISKYHFENGDEYGAKIYNLAPKLDQADIVYNNTWQMIMLDPDYKKKKAMIDEARQARQKIDDSFLQRHRMTDLYYPEFNSTIKKIAFSAKKSDGFNPSVCICDELASWEGDRGLKQYDVMKSGMGARSEPIMFSCTTAGYINDSIFDELMRRATRFLLGDSKENRLLPVLYMIDDVEKWNDLNELKKSNRNLGVSISYDYMLEEIAIAEGSLPKKNEFMVKYCNIKQNSSLAWLSTKTVEKCINKPLRAEDLVHSYAVAGIDLSQTTDLTCALVLVERDGIINVLPKFWLPKNKLEDAIARDNLPYELYIQKGWLELSGEEFVDYHDCYNWLVQMVEKYQILPQVVGYDRYSSQYLIQDMKTYGFVTDDVYQGDNLWGVLQEMEGLLKEGRINIGDNDLMKIHLLNAGIKMNKERGRGKLIKLNASAHIDGCAALADALCVRQKHYSEIGERLKNESV
jgi:phage terminase large subunit-like protein